jgi:beta-glucosidase-like glycosyl hydrolase/CubicO group peptidase (beta-lactamase class C family)
MRPTFIRLIGLHLLVFFLFAGQVQVAASDEPSRRRGPSSLLSIQSSWVDSVINELSLGEKIGQLFMVAAYSNKGPEHSRYIMRLIRKHHIGGLIFFQGHPSDQAKLTNVYQNYSDVPLMIGMDAEWGPGMRLDSVLSYPRQMALGAVRNDSLIYRMGLDIGAQLRRLGVHINFAPVVDVNNNPDNPVIGSRSFGSDRFNVARKGIAYMNGLQDQCVLAVAKHFPGHGDTDQDSHKVLPVVHHDSTRLDTLELYPFRRMIENGVGGMMMAHLNVPAYIDESHRPATLSSPMVNGLLKERMGFKGLVFTDALNMKGVTSHFSPGIIEAEALKAGNDVLLYPRNVPEAISYIKKEVRRGNISKQRIDESCRKILAFKYWAGLDSLSSCGEEDQMNEELIRREGLIKDLNQNDYKVLRNQLISSSLTLNGRTAHRLPLRQLDSLRMASLALGSQAVTPFQRTMDLYARVDHYHYASGGDLENFSTRLDDYNLLLVSIHNTHEIPSRQYGLHPDYSALIRQLPEDKPMVLVHFGNPYALQYLPPTVMNSAVITAFNDKAITQKKAAQAVFGAIPVDGRMPVAVNDSLKAGQGTDVPGISRLSYGLPEAAGLHSDTLRRIDTLVQAAIDSLATPGCQVLVARHGKVIYHRAFGSHTYLRKQPVKRNDLYDVASVTKITAAIPSLMQLYEDDAFALDSTLSRYLPHLDTTNKGDLVIRDVLTHQARLKSWIPFYYKTLQPLYPDQNLLNSEFSPEYPYKIGNHSYMAKNFLYADNVYSRTPSDSFSVQVADDLFIREDYTDSIFRWIDQSELLDKKDYVYSDLGYYYFYRIIEQITASPLEDHVRQAFYEPLGAFNTGYLPLERFDRKQIVPTENDMIFRRQLLRGHVHDPGTAMLGGVCGHAGIFSTANDLAKIMQMYLNGGYYGGHRYFRDSTLRLFTHSPFKEKNGNRRALGFDKPVLEKDKPGPTCKGISEKSFGHSGFTGTIAWADPEEEVVYIFLSNRIHPDQDNLKLVSEDVRTRIQKVVYDAIIDKDVSRSQ